MRPDLILTDAMLVTHGELPVPRAFLAMAGGRILDCGPMERLPPSEAPRLSLPGRVLTPGLINTHTHAVLSLMRGIAVDLGFAPAYTPGIPHGHEIAPAEAVALARLGAMEALLMGSTVMVDSYVHGEVTLPAIAGLGLRVWGCGRLHDVDFSGVHLARWRHVPEIGDLRLAEVETLIARFHGSHEGRAHVIVAPHAPDTCSTHLLCRAADLARDAGLLTTLHLSQSQLEKSEIQRRDGCTPTELLERTGLLDDRLIAAHCIHMTPEDIARFGASGATVAHLPRSDASGGATANTPALRAAGARLALGTDNLTQDMVEQMRWALATARIRVGSVGQNWQPEDAFAMATVHGAAALGKSGRLGQLAPGCAADVVAWDFRRAHLTPLLDPLGTLVHDANGRDVEHVWIAGRQVVESGRPTQADEAAVRAEAQRVAEGLWARARANAA